MKNTSLLFLGMVLTIFMKVNGQDNKLSALQFQAGYFGETLTHSGINMGVEYQPHHIGKVQTIIAGNIGGYVHVRNNTSLFLRGQWGQRATFHSGVFVDEFMGLGYLHHFTNGGQIYEVLPNGAVVESPNSGSPMIMPSLGVGTGYDFSKKTNKRLLFYLRPELFWKAPFNGYYLTHFALNTGVIFSLGK